MTAVKAPSGTPSAEPDPSPRDADRHARRHKPPGVPCAAIAARSTVQVAERRVNNIKGLALGQWGTPNIVNCTVGAGIVSALTQVR
jgi:hypothetical protein